MRQVFDSGVLTVHLPSNVYSDVAFRSLDRVGARNENDYGAQYWACVYPGRCYTHGNAAISVRL